MCWWLIGVCVWVVWCVCARVCFCTHVSVQVLIRIGMCVWLRACACARACINVGMFVYVCMHVSVHSGMHIVIY